jgi:hypothetical protein
VIGCALEGRFTKNIVVIYVYDVNVKRGKVKKQNEEN